ncbi:hypothetical protein HanIR_Chr12g0565631 [Helianthus annuus]|nr:hypothetical protein HanIR_Chr12g0565631 [Helianthus annuus]
MNEYGQEIMFVKLINKHEQMFVRPFTFVNLNNVFIYVRLVMFICVRSFKVLLFMSICVKA